MESDPDTRTGDQGADRYRFGNVVVDALAHTICRDQQAVAVEPKSFAVLLVLLRHADQLVLKDDLLDAVWGHRHVTPGVLTRAIAQLRAALDDEALHPRYIQTQHALGYRFIGVLAADGEATAVAPALEAVGISESEVRTTSNQVPAQVLPQIASPDVAGGAGLPGNETQDHFHRAWPWLALLLSLAVLAAFYLQRRPATAPLLANPSVAVLPFTTLGDDPQDRYFAEGLSTEMLQALAGVHGLKVAAWRPAEAIDRTQDIAALGKALGVATVLDASVRREGQRLRINARLSDTRSGYTLWSKSYDGDAGAVFDTQTEIAQEVARTLVGALPDAGEGLRKRLTPTHDVAAFNAYLVGMYQLLQPDKGDGVAGAESYFRQALTTDAGFARAQAGLCRLELWNFESNRDPEAFDNARLACIRAENMDRSLGQVALALGDLYRIKGDATRARAYYDSLLDDPAMRPDAMVGRAQLYVDQGHGDLAIEQFRKAIAERPGDAGLYAELGYQQFRMSQYQDALDSYRTVVRLRPDRSEYWSIYGGLLVAAGENAAAAAALERSLAIEPNESSLSNLGTLKYQAGQYAEAVALYRKATELNPTDFFYWGYLGDALMLLPASATQAREAFTKAASLAQRFVDLKPDDAKALAALGWYRANLGQRAQALELLARSEKLGAEPGEVAVFNAQTFALLGDAEQASQRIATALALDIPESRIRTNAVLRRAGLTALARQPAGGLAHSANQAPTRGE